MSRNTNTTTRTETETQTLTAEEERIVRMLKGVSEPGDSPLEFVTSSDNEVNARLLNMEAELLAMMHQQGPRAQNSAKSSILARLKELEEK